MRRALSVLIIAAAFGLAGCSHKPPRVAPATNTAVPTNGGAESSGAGGANANEGAAEANGGGQGAAGPQEGLLAKHTIYFDFDSSEIKGDGTDIVSAHAKYLAGHPNVKVRLEGNTDERGSREYNIGLGERRAQAVRRALLLQGASDGQISTVSYGAERPVDPGHDEAAWAKNRRVEIVYLQ
ncbi:MAG TPA: peptidoglycan-associated lipoprotein Pal [Steroidobacteraceae bacterium]|nr:peptidoglycan-associated lipoprotein Pal [Steroidobacteraceae bacterium]